MTAILAVVGALILSILANEIFAWLPRLAERIVLFASSRFREPVLRDRFHEEWKAAIADIPGGLAAVIHAITLVLCVRDVERSCAAEISRFDVDERFAELGQTVRDFTETFSSALVRRGLTLDDVAQLTKVSIRDLKALMRGDLRKIVIGYRQIFAYMTDLSSLLGPDYSMVRARYAELIRKSGGLPPVPAATRGQRVARVWCSVAGHRATKEFVHSSNRLPFHWSFLRCRRCGDVSIMQAQPCSGIKVLSKVDFDAPVSEKFACETEDLTTYSSLDSPDPHGAMGERIEMTRERRTAYAREEN